MEERSSLDNKRQIIHPAGNVDDHSGLPTVENLCGPPPSIGMFALAHVDKLPCASTNEALFAHL